MRPWLGQHRQSCALLATSLPLKFLNQQPTLPLPLPLPHLLPHSQFYLSNHSIPFSQCSTSDTSGPWQQAPATQLPPSRLNSPLPPLGLALNAESQSGTVLLPENQQRRGMRRGFNTSRALGREPWPPCLLCAMVQIALVCTKENFYQDPTCLPVPGRARRSGTVPSCAGSGITISG